MSEVMTITCGCAGSAPSSSGEEMPPASILTLTGNSPAQRDSGIGGLVTHAAPPVQRGRRGSHALPSIPDYQGQAGQGFVTGRFLRQPALTFRGTDAAVTGMRLIDSGESDQLWRMLPGEVAPKWACAPKASTGASGTPRSLDAPLADPKRFAHARLHAGSPTRRPGVF